MIRSVKIASLLLVLMVLQGCTDNRAPEEIVRERSQERLDMLMAKNLEGAFEYMTPGYREITSIELYSLRIGGVVNWTEANVGEVSCEPEICHVKAIVSYKIERLNIMNTRPIDEKWLKLDGEWYLYYK